MYLFVIRPVEIPSDLASGCRTVKLAKMNDGNYRKAPLTVNPLLGPRGAYVFQAHLRGEGGGGLIETGSLFNLETTTVSVLHKELEHKVDQNQIKSELPVDK